MGGIEKEGAIPPVSRNRGKDQFLSQNLARRRIDRFHGLFELCRL